MTVWMSDSWGTREQAIPGEWTALVLIIVIGAAFGFLVLWFTMLRHERAVPHRARQRSDQEPRLIGDAQTVGLFADAATAAIVDEDSAVAQDSPDSDAGDAEDSQGAAGARVAAALEDDGGELVPAAPDAEPADIEAIDSAPA